MSLLTCQDASFSYEGTAVLSDLCFSVEAGDYLCIVGENGAGKSTLLKGLLHLKKPSSGLVYCIIDIRSNNACNISRFMVK